MSLKKSRLSNLNLNCHQSMPQHNTDILVITELCVAAADDVDLPASSQLHSVLGCLSELTRCVSCSKDSKALYHSEYVQKDTPD